MRRTGFPAAVLVAGSLAGCGGEPPAPEPETPGASPAEALIERSINYHDPEERWAGANLELRIAESRPGSELRTATVRMNPGDGSFLVERHTEEGHTALEVRGEEIMSRSVDGAADLDEEGFAGHGLDPERVIWLRNYYLFVWGLPMKLRDPGTIVDPEPIAEAYDGQEALKVRVTYDPEVGGDTWYFYFHPDTARLIGYRFYHDESANDGEYIRLAGEIEDRGLRIPAKRSWFFHSNDEFLGEDEAMSLAVTP